MTTALNRQVAEAGVQQRLRIPSDRPLFPGCPALFVQTDGTPRQVEAAAAVCRGEGLGAVQTVRVQDRNKRLKALAAVHRSAVGSCESVLFDADRYSGPGRVIGAANLDREWVEAQRAEGCVYALTDSPYIPAGDRPALESVLTQAATFGENVIAALPLDKSWLTRGSAELLESINGAGVPVALMLEHHHDPFGVQAAVKGLVDILSGAAPKVLLLRSDLSAIGAVAWGASVGAIGTKTSLRHIFPIPKKRSNGGPGAFVAAYVPRAMAYRTLPKIAEAIALTTDEQDWWHCECSYCYGRSIEWIANETEAFQHSLAAIADQATRILGSPGTAALRRQAWVEACRHAQSVNLELQAKTDIGWESPDFLGGWHKAMPPGR